MDSVAWAIVVVVGVSALAIVAMARRRSWNADGSDDDRRIAEDSRDMQDAD